jgi:hypothetical protein
MPKIWAKEGHAAKNGALLQRCAGRTDYCTVLYCTELTCSGTGFTTVNRAAATRASIVDKGHPYWKGGKLEAPGVNGGGGSKKTKQAQPRDGYSPLVKGR